jgi:hypothetical protein
MARTSHLPVLEHLHRHDRGRVDDIKRWIQHGEISAHDGCADACQDRIYFMHAESGGLELRPAWSETRVKSVQIES